MVAENDEGRVTETDPPLTLPGMTSLTVDTHGRLMTFIAIPPRQKSSATSTPVDWSKFFESAGGDFEGLRPVQPRWSAPVDTDEKLAWEGTFRGDPKTPIRIEAASYDGKPVWFRILGPWASPKPELGMSAVQRVNRAFFSLLFPGLIVVAIFLARRNLLRGRGDRRTAMRLALFVFAVGMTGFIFRIDHVSDPGEEWDLLDRALAFSVYPAAQAWLLYLALEPYVRRRWPHTLISWTRLFAGRFRDPMIGRDLLVALIAGPAVLTLKFMTVHAPSWFGQPKLPPLSSWVTPLVATRNLVFAACSHAVNSIFIGLIVLFLFLVAYMVFRRKWAAMLLLGVVATFGVGAPAFGPAYEIPAGAIMAAIIVFVLVRFGLLAFVLTTFLTAFLEAVPITLDPEAWYFGRSLAVLLVLFAVAIYGFWSSLGDKPAFGVALPEEA